MDQVSLEDALSDLPLGKIQYFNTIGSTNDVAVEWTHAGVPDFSLVVANEQSQGRGRAGRKWFTPSGSALAFSLLLRPQPEELQGEIPRYTALGALAVSDALADNYGLEAEIKWPNDVLLEGKKVCGILAEAHWMGDQLEAIVLGIGINVAPSSVPPDGMLNFPATSVESVLGRPVERLPLLKNTLANLIGWRLKLNSPAFLAAWEARLAYLNEWVQVISGSQKKLTGQIRGIDSHGRLKLQLSSGEEFALQAGEFHLRPLVDRSPK